MTSIEGISKTPPVIWWRGHGPLLGISPGASGQRIPARQRLPRADSRDGRGCSLVMGKAPRGIGLGAHGEAGMPRGCGRVTYRLVRWSRSWRKVGGGGRGRRGVGRVGIGSRRCMHAIQAHDLCCAADKSSSLGVRGPAGFLPDDVAGRAMGPYDAIDEALLVLPRTGDFAAIRLW